MESQGWQNAENFCLTISCECAVEVRHSGPPIALHVVLFLPAPYTADDRNSDRQAMVQAPAANHKETADTMQETFSLSNISPQIGRGFNRSAPKHCS